MNKVFNISLILLALGTSELFSAHIIFDLGGVLVEPNKSSVAKKAGFLNLALYALTHMENPRTSLYNILNEIEPYTQSEIITYDENGQPLPGIMCDWLRGIPSKKILGSIQDKITQEHALWPLAQAIFEPHSMASTQYIIKEGEIFVQECIEQGHCVYILSNWDPISFTYLEQHYPEFFGLFSGIVISGDCGLLKPDIRIYTHLLLEYKLDPKDCFFVDNQMENVSAAANVGISGSHVQTTKGKPNFDKVRTDLEEWGNKQLQHA